jgi:hypothetical protein
VIPRRGDGGDISSTANTIDLIRIFTERGDLAHLALLLWAMSATALAWFALRELTAASRRFDDFVRELARFNELSETIDGNVHYRCALSTVRRKISTIISIFFDFFTTPRP